MKEFRIRWKRIGIRAKTKIFQAYPARKFSNLKEPWRATGAGSPEEFACCAGYDCGCGGKTAAESVEGVPPLEYLELQVREVGQWKKKEGS